jgi:eukaryotic-like serine/threonine-protein kinase
MSDDAIGREIGSYKITDLIGRGGMGFVYRAQHPYIGKQVAIKLLKSEHSSDTEVLQRFLQEAKSVNNIQHENVIDILDFGRTKDNEYFIIMELLEGETLSQAISKEAPFSLKRAANISLQICAALSAAHKNNILHRDLKSDNIFLIQRAGQKDFVKVLDFGIAKLLGDSSSNHTTTGMVMGTPLYMAPEQALGRPLDAQTDVYALGVILYQMATGTVPFYDANPVALATMHVTAKVPRPSSCIAGVNPEFEKIILTCLEKEMTDRFASMRDAAEAIAAVSKLDLASYFVLSPESRLPSEVETPLTATQTPSTRRGALLKSTLPSAIAGFLCMCLVVGALWAFGGSKEKEVSPAPKAPTAPVSMSAPFTIQVTNTPTTKPVEEKPSSTKTKAFKPSPKPSERPDKPNTIGDKPLTF